MARRLNAARLQAMCDAVDARELHAELVRALSVLEPGERRAPAEACFMNPKEAGRFIWRAMGKSKTRARLRDVMLSLPGMLQIKRFEEAVLAHERPYSQLESYMAKEIG